MARKHFYLCPACGVRKVEIIETNYRQKAYEMGMTMQSWAAPKWEEIPEEAVKFQAVCRDGVNGCGFAAQAFDFHPRFSSESFSGSYKKTPEQARASAKASLHRLQGANNA